MNSIIKANGVEISIMSSNKQDDYISLTDIAKYKTDNPTAVIQNWIRNRETIEFLGLWEKLNNKNFKPLEFEGFKKEAGSNTFILSPQKWINCTNAIGIVSKSGRYGGGTFAHTDIAFEFASWISPEFKLYIMKDYQRLKQNETYHNQGEWDVNRIISKANYRIHTDAIKENLIPPNITKAKQGYVYANEADLLNVALFGQTAQQWRDENHKTKSSNIRDEATIEQLIVLSNLESTNAFLIKNGINQEERLIHLRQLAISQLNSLLNTKSIKNLNNINDNPKLPIL